MAVGALNSPSYLPPLCQLSHRAASSPCEADLHTSPRCHTCYPAPHPRQRARTLSFLSAASFCSRARLRWKSSMVREEILDAGVSVGELGGGAGGHAAASAQQ